jgi:outer membrane protein OmpA-like peptidoglycan-associated protein
MTMHRQTLIACLLLMGISVAQASAQDSLSSSIMRPSVLNADTGLIAGRLPGGDSSRTFYVAVDLKAGDLLAQLSVEGRANTQKKVTLELLGADARAKHSHYVMAGLDATGETTRTYPVDANGRHILRVIVEGVETGSFCVLLGGSAFPAAKPAECPSQPSQRQAAAPPRQVIQPAEPPKVETPPPALPKVVEVIESRCEHRLRIGSDVLFDFDRFVIRSEASAALQSVAEIIVGKNKPVTIEGHTDGKGTDSYNQTLSERRAMTVENELRYRMVGLPPMAVRGFGKTRPVAANQLPDGADNPEGRQKNRRVELVINTCA